MNLESTPLQGWNRLPSDDTASTGRFTITATSSVLKYHQLKKNGPQLTWAYLKAACCLFLSFIFDFIFMLIIGYNIDFFCCSRESDVSADWAPMIIVFWILISQPFTALVLLRGWKQTPILNRYASEGIHIPATVIDRRRERRHDEWSYEAVLEYKPDPLDSSIVYAKIMNVSPEDFMEPTFDIIVLPGIPSSAVLEKGFEVKKQRQWVMNTAKVSLFATMILWFFVFGYAAHLIRHRTENEDDVHYQLDTFERTFSYHLEGGGDEIVVHNEELGRLWRRLWAAFASSWAGALGFRYFFVALLFETMNEEMLRGSSGQVALSESSTGNDPPIQGLQSDRASSTGGTGPMGLVTSTSSRCYDRLKKDPTDTMNVVLHVFGFYLAFGILVCLTAYGINLFMGDGSNGFDITVFLLGSAVGAMLTFIQPFVSAFLLYNWLRNRVLSRYASEGRNISATAIYRKEVFDKHSTRYEVVIEYKPDPMDPSTIYSKILDVPREDFELSTFEIIVLPDIPSSAVLKRQFEQKASVGQSVAHESEVASTFRLIVGCGPKMVYFSSLALVCFVLEYLIHYHHFENENGDEIPIDHEGLRRCWEGWGICLILAFSWAVAWCLAHLLAATQNEKMIRGRSAPALLFVSANDPEAAHLLGYGTAATSGETESDQGMIHLGHVDSAGVGSEDQSRRLYGSN